MKQSKRSVECLIYQIGLPVSLLLLIYRSVQYVNCFICLRFYLNSKYYTVAAFIVQIGPFFSEFRMLQDDVFMLLKYSLQMNTLSIEQDMLFLKKDCDEKDATIKELTTLLHSSEVSGSQVT